MQGRILSGRPMAIFLGRSGSASIGLPMAMASNAPSSMQRSSVSTSPMRLPQMMGMLTASFAARASSSM